MGTIAAAVVGAVLVVAVGPVTGRQSSGSQIYSVRVAGGGLVNLSSGRGSDWAPSVSPDGRRIAFLRASGPAGVELWVMNADGSAQRRLAGGVLWDGFTRAPAWSPDGRRIGFVGSPSGGAAGVWTVGADGADLRRLADGEAGPVWSPDGRLLAFDTFDRSTCGPIDRNCATALLTVIRPDGTERKVVAKAAIWPSWSPSGTRLAFAGGTSGTDVGYIGVVSAAGGVPRTIVRPGFRVVGAPAWSPGGRSIAFVAGLAAGAQSIYRVDPDHGSPRRLVTRRGGVGAVAWSPDGRRLAYAFDADGRGRTSIWVLRSDGSHRRVVAHVEGRAVVDTLAWSRAGRLVFAVP